MALRLVPFLHRATHAVGLHVAELRVIQGEAHVLAHLHESGPCSIAGLNAVLHHRRSTLTSILDRLEARGLIKRQTDPSDRRTFVVRLTPAGERLARKVHRHFELLERSVRERFSQKELEVVQRVLIAITEL